MHIVLVVAAALITFATTLRVSAQTDPALPATVQSFVYRDGQWQVFNSFTNQYQPLSKKTCDDNYYERSNWLIDLERSLKGCSCTTNISALAALIGESKIENYLRQQACVAFANEKANEKNDNKRAIKKRAGVGPSRSRTASGSVQGQTAAKSSKPSVLAPDVARGGSSAMDRLGGGSGGSGDSRRGRLPAGSAAAGSKSAVTAPASFPKADAIGEFGKCASCGKITPVR